MTYGVVPTGFQRKRLPEILADLEAAMIAEFGPGVIQSSQSPIGQLNGVMSDITSDHWEITEDTYQSFDVDQASGRRLDMLGKLRRLPRLLGETDAAYQLRLTNQDQADIKLAANIGRLRHLGGVSFAWGIENYGSTSNAFGMPAHSVAYSASGGDDATVGLAVYQLSVPGIELIGNVEVQVVADGYCRMVRFVRPETVPIRVEVDVSEVPTASRCAPPSVGTLQAGLEAAFSGDRGFKNGEAVLRDRVEMEASRLGSIKVVETRIARLSDLIIDDTLPMTLFERAAIVSPHVVFRYV